jgi:hypothetical protein
MRLSFICVGVLATGCAARGVPEQQQPVAASARADGRAPIVFEGMCDASGAVALGGDMFVVGDDEDNILRVYDARRGGPPLKSVDLSPDLELPTKKKPPEADIEAATGLGSLSFWLTSHGRNSAGKKQPSRLRFFATEETDAGPKVVGHPYSHLLDDLLADARLAPFGLTEAEALAPKSPGGLNIEGMTAMADGRSLLIGFRSPVPQGKALVVPVLNPTEVVREGTRARLGEPRLLDLGGLGIRSLSWWHGRYLIISGGTASESTSRLFTWRGGDDAPVAVSEVDLTGLNPEAFFTPEQADEILLLSDDGTVPLDGEECKRLKDPARKRFRGVWVRLPPEPT